MKNILAWVLSITLILLAGCKSNRPDMSGLLSTVPSSAAAVVGVHLKNLAEDAGCKVTDNEIKPGKEVKAMMEKMNDNDRAEPINLFAGSSGIVPDYAILFSDANRTFLTLGLYDVNKFKEFVNKDKNTSFSDAGNGVQVCENIAVRGNQAWVCLSSSKRIDPDAIVAYSGLSTSQSFLNTDMAKVILDSDDDIIGWGNFNTVMSNLLSRQDMGVVTIAAGFLFEDVDALRFSVDFEKGEMEASMVLLNDKGKPAKYLLPAEKISGKALKALGGSCDALIAFTVTPKLVQRIEKVATALGGTMFGDLKETLKNIDGTIGLALGLQNNAINGVITTKGNVSNQLTGMLSMLVGNTTQDGDYLRFSKGNVSGGISVENCADLLKGYSMGMVADFTGVKSAGASYGASVPGSLSTATIGLEPYDGSLKLCMELKTADEKENFLMSLIKAM